MKKKLFWLVLLFVVQPCLSQSIVVNTPDSIFYLNQGTLCGFSWAGTYCGTTGVLSTALHKDTLYILSTTSVLYRMKLGDPSTCVAITTLPANDPFNFGRSTINSMTTDKYGIIYTADGWTTDILRYNPYTNSRQVLGRVGVFPGGDMMFYNNKLLLATAINGIYEVNLNDPSASQQYMSADGHNFYGLVSVPFDCTRNKYYGLEVTGAAETKLYDLDLANKVVGPFVCILPKQIYDGASSVDDGNTIGVSIDSINIQGPCRNESIATVQFIAHSATNGPLTYVLDGTSSNTSGLFNSVSEGAHTVSIHNTIGCFKDSLIVIRHGLSQVMISSIDPQSCAQQDGTISINATSGYPLTYSIDQGTFQTNPVFNNLSQGSHLIKIRDAGGCEIDTSIFLRYQVKPTFFSSFGVQATVCESRTGGITVTPAPGINPGDITVALFNGPRQPLSSLQNMDSGYYPVSLFFQNSCRYDTIIRIDRLTNDRPIIDIQTSDQKCTIDNGAVSLFINGTHDPYLVDFNGTGFSSNINHNGLAPGSYSIVVKDRSTCTFDTLAVIRPYVVSPWTVVVDTTDPTCVQPEKGSITVNISGAQSPYRISLNNRTYSNGSVIEGLGRGDYKLYVLNNDDCRIDSLKVRLDMKQAPECDFVFVPTAFTPNKDGLNDILVPYLGAGVTNFQFSIYNRWGQLVYYSNARGTGWDGLLSGKAQPSGVYAWTLSYQTESTPANKLIKGTLTLIR